MQLRPAESTADHASPMRLSEPQLEYLTQGRPIETTPYDASAARESEREVESITEERPIDIKADGSRVDDF